MSDSFFKKLILVEVFLIIFFFLVGMISLQLNIMPFYLLSCLGICLTLFVFVRTVMSILHLIANAIELQDDNVVKKDYRS